MASIKIHVFIGENDGTESCDFRGENFIGSEQGDEHRTIAEKDPATEEEVALALELGPKINKLLSGFAPAEGIESVLGKEVGLRIGVWDE